MTPKEKAEELVDKYYSIVWHNGKKVCSMSKQAAKLCALIAVDEVLDAIVIINEYDFEPLNEYWQEVKQEIEKL